MLRLAALASLLLVQDRVVEVAATVETAPVRHAGDAADDPAIWVHPDDPVRSLVFGDDKEGGIGAWALDGREVQVVDPEIRINNIDLRYGFALGGKKVDLLAAADETNRALRFYAIGAEGRLEPAGGVPKIGLDPYGLCLYRSATSGALFCFVTGRDGALQQWELRDDGGRVAAAKVREIDVGGLSEGCVADDALGALYVGEEAVGVWRYGAEPGAGAARTRVDGTKKGGNLKADVEGLALYDAGEGRGYLIASSQGDHSFAIYRREAGNAFVGRFRVVDGAVDGVSDTDGIDVSSAALGPAFPKGLFVAQDGANAKPAARQNFNLVPWEAIASRFDPPLLVAPASPR